MLTNYDKFIGLNIFCIRINKVYEKYCTITLQSSIHCIMHSFFHVFNTAPDSHLKLLDHAFNTIKFFLSTKKNVQILSVFPCFMKFYITLITHFIRKFYILKILFALLVIQCNKMIKLLYWLGIIQINSLDVLPILLLNSSTIYRMRLS